VFGSQLILSNLGVLRDLGTCQKNDVISFFRKRLFLNLRVGVMIRVTVRFRGRFRVTVSENTFKYFFGETSSSASL